MEFKKVATSFTFESTLKMVDAMRPYQLLAIERALPKGSTLAHTVTEGTYKDAQGSVCSLVSVRITTTADGTTVKRALASVEASAIKVRTKRAPKARVIPAKRAPKAPTAKAGATGTMFGRPAVAEAPATVDVAPVVRRVVRNAIRVA